MNITLQHSIKLTMIFLSFGLICLVGCGYIKAGQRQQASNLNGVNGPQGWNTHRDPRGFSLQIPAAWKVSADNSGRIDVCGTKDERLVIWPVMLKTKVNDEIAASVLRSVASKARPDVEWQGFEPKIGNYQRLLGTANGQSAVAVFTWANNAQGASGYVYTIVAPKARYQQNSEVYAQILKSFRVTNADAKQGAVPTAETFSFVRWQDPLQNAFSLDVPRGWQVNGGAYRFAPMDVRFELMAQSPDNQIRITSGDRELATFAHPSDADRFIGNTSGSVDLMGYRAYFKQYAPGAKFAREYVQTKATRGCSNLQFRNERERPELVQAINAIYARYEAMGVPIRYDAGEVAFTCDCGGQPIQGYYLAVTWFIQGSTGGALWAVERLYGYLSTNGKADQAQTAMVRMAQSAEINPQWAAQQQHITRQAVRIGTDTMRAVSDALLENYWSHTRSRDEHMRQVTNAIAGTEDVIDPQTGQQYSIYSGSNYYWINRGETITGTNTYDRPNTDFREMVRLP